MTVFRTRLLISAVAVSAVWSFGASLGARPPQQAPRAVTAADYARAEKFLAAGVNGLVVGGSVAATWLQDDAFWYRTALVDGTTPTILVDPLKRTRLVCAPAVAECARVETAQPPAAAVGGGRGGRGGGGGRGAGAAAATRRTASH